MKRFIAGIIFIFLLVPLVTGATLKCPPKAPADRVACTLEGNGTGKLYLKSIDGIPAEDYTIILEHDHRDFISSNSRHEAVELPARILFWANNALKNVVDSYVSSIPDWLLLNKEHTFVFELVMENGSRKTFNKKIFLVRNSNWEGLRKDLVDSLWGAFILWTVLVVFWGIVEWQSNRDLMRPKEFIQLTLSSSALIIAIVFSLYNSQPITFGIPYYYFGNGNRLWGDIVVWWGIWALTTLIPMYGFVYLQITPNLERTAYRKTVSELMKQKLGECSGLAWFIAPFLLVSGALDSEIKSFLLMSLVIILAVSTHSILKILKPEGVLLINLSTVGFLALKYHPDSVFVVFLAILLFAVYLTQIKCLRRFKEEKERLITEIEKNHENWRDKK
ncbi:hypothetical protein [Thermococcus sp.]|uniref:hypothetical protein n=1 Tax=Thermococcus sp. TaxID=35749 RepID=UPI0025FE495E|nr:hypothetical protein [Thermococcus sp.]